MLIAYDQPPYFQIVTGYQGLAQSLPVILVGCGFSRETNPSSYSWYGYKCPEANRLHLGDLEFMMIQYTTKGWGMLDYEGKQHRVNAGDAMIIYFPHENHYWLPKASPYWEFYYLSLRGAFTLDLAKRIIDRYGPVIHLDNRPEIAQQVKDCAQGVYANQESTHFELSLMSYALCMSMFKVYVAGKRKDYPDSIGRTLEYCANHFFEEITIDQLTKVAGLSRFHFTRLFKNVTGETPIEYLNSLRINEATRMLLHSNQLSIKEVANACGFKDQSYFCKLFRQRTGLSPGVYRSFDKTQST